MGRVECCVAKLLENVRPVNCLKIERLEFQRATVSCNSIYGTRESGAAVAAVAAGSAASAAAVAPSFVCLRDVFGGKQ